MKTIIKVEKEVNLVTLRMQVAVRYGEEDMPNDYPFRENDMWDVYIDIDSGQIQDWPSGVAPLDLYMKITDQGSYFLIDEYDDVIMKIEDEYVPNRLVPGKYGDYIDLKIDANGKITNWLKNPSFEDFMSED